MARRGVLSGGSIYDDFKPVSEWKYGQAQQSHLLLINLPGFSKEQIKVSTEGTDILRIRGERLIGRNKWSQFQEDFRIPDDCNIRGIRAKFESGTLTITMPKKSPISTPLVNPKKEQTQKEKLEAPIVKPDNGKRENIGQETKEKENAKVMEKLKETKENEVVKEATLVNPKSEKKDEEKSEEVKEKEIDKSRKLIEGLNIVKETTKESEGDGMEKETLKPKYLYKNTETKIISEEQNEKEKKRHDQVVDGTKMGNVAKEEGEEKEVLKPEYYFKNIEKIIESEVLKRKEKKRHDDGIKGKEKEVLKPKYYTENVAKENEKYEEIMKSGAKGELGEDRQLIVNMGVAVLVIVALGASIYYGTFKKGKV